MNARPVLLCAAAAWALAGTASAGWQAEALARSVTDAVRECRQLTIFDHVTAHVEEDVAVLSGKVTHDAKRVAVERRVATIPGVRRVNNAISVLPVSRRDEDLRYRVSRAIYGHPSFWSYAALPNPPIHIIVEDGHVTLAGVVNSQVERAMARSLASGRGERSLADELLTATGR